MGADAVLLRVALGFAIAVALSLACERGASAQESEPTESAGSEQTAESRESSEGNPDPGESPNGASLDLTVFSQADDIGDPLKAEQLDYFAMRVTLRVQLEEELSLRLNGALAYIDNPDSNPLPASILNAATTSASGDLVTSDSSLSLVYKPIGSDWTFAPGLFYHHQIDFLSAGLDLALDGELFDGNTTLSLSYTLRVDVMHLNVWDGTFRGDKTRISHNMLFGVTQLLSDSVKLALSVQVTRQDGALFDPYNYVVLFNGADQPVLLVDERLPNERNRVQFNARLRVSPALGASLGLDLGYYVDDWGIEHASIEVSAELAFSADVRWRLWYRFAIQDGTRFHNAMPRAESTHQTRDRDLADFTLHAPGTLMFVRLGPWEGAVWALRASVYAFSRDDGVYAIGGSIGFVAGW